MDAPCYATSASLELPDGCYVGETLAREPHGVGCVAFPDGGFYKGQWRCGVWHGKGELWMMGDHYVGEFADGEFHGVGRLRTLEGDVHEGRFERGAFAGRCSDDVPSTPRALTPAQHSTVEAFAQKAFSTFGGAAYLLHVSEVRRAFLVTAEATVEAMTPAQRRDLFGDAAGRERLRVLQECVGGD